MISNIKLHIYIIIKVSLINLNDSSRKIIFLISARTLPLRNVVIGVHYHPEEIFSDRQRDQW